MAQKLFSCDQVSFTRGAGEALTAYKFVKSNSSDTKNVDLCDTAGEAAIGVLDSDWDSGDEAVKVIYGGIAYAMAGGAIAVGNLVTVDASGRGIKAAGTVQADFIVGIAMTAASAAGDLFSIRLVPQGGYVASTGAASKLLVIPIASGAGDESAEQDTGYELPAAAVVRNVYVRVTDAEAQTIDVGTDGTGSNDPDGFLDALSIAATGVFAGSLANGAQTLGALLSVDEDGAGALVPRPDTTSGGESITWTASANLTSFAGSIVIDYIEVS